jgi:hypothetical protein
MKLHIDNHGFEGNLPEERIDMTIENSAKMFSILSDGIYKDKILAVIREYICNAYDAHVSAGKRDVPFTVRLPSRLDSTFSVSDEGTGVDPALIGKIFWTYGASTKSEDEDTIGALGLGSKSAFAYTKSSFIVKNRYKGIEYTYFCFINEKGTPQGSKVGESPTDSSDGITVEFAVRPEDNNAFYDRFSRIYKNWANVKPNIIGVDLDLLDLAKPKKIIEGTNWYLESQSQYVNKSISLAIMGNVAYPIEFSSIPNLPESLKIIANNPFKITFPLGDLEFASSRETLSYTEFTCKQLIKRLEEVRTELAESFYEKVFIASKDHLSLYYAFKKTFAEFREAVYLGKSDNTTTEILTKLLLGKNSEDTIEFQGAKFNIEDLINGTFRTTFDGYQSFGMYNSTTRGRSSRFHLEPVTKLSAIVKEDVDSKDYYIDRYRSDYVLDAGTEILNNIDWRAKIKSPRSMKPSTFESVLMTIDKFNFTTNNKFVISLKRNNLVFVINDIGSSGRDRFRAFVTNQPNGSSFTNSQLIYIEFNAKVTSLEEVTADLRTIISKHLTGATINYISAMPDVRAPIEKIKIDKESIKLKVAAYNFGDSSRLLVGTNYISDSKLAIIHDSLVFSRIVDKVISLQDLRSSALNLFVIKRRSPNTFYEDVGSSNLSICKDSHLLKLASYIEAFEDATFFVDDPDKVYDNVTRTYSMVMKKRKSMHVLILNEGQHANLVKKGIKLTPLKSHLASKLQAMDDVEKFTSVTERLITLSKVRHIKGFYEGTASIQELNMTDIWKDDVSLFKSLFKEYSQLRQNVSQCADAFAKLDLLNIIDPHRKTKDLSRLAQEFQLQIDDQYPMLSLIEYRMPDFTKAKKIIAYIEQIEHLIDDAIEETTLEFQNDVQAAGELVQIPL